MNDRQNIGCDSAAIDQILEDDGYRVSRIDRLCWRGRYRTRQRVFPFMIHISEERELLTMAVIPYMKSPDDEALAASLYDRLLELNQVLLLAKFSIDDDLDVVLSVSHPTTSLQPSELRDGLSALLYYADNHHQELTDLLAVA